MSNDRYFGLYIQIDKPLIHLEENLTFDVPGDFEKQRRFSANNGEFLFVNYYKANFDTDTSYRGFISQLQAIRGFDNTSKNYNLGGPSDDGNQKQHVFSSDSLDDLLGFLKGSPSTQKLQVRTK